MDLLAGIADHRGIAVAGDEEAMAGQAGRAERHFLNKAFEAALRSQGFDFYDWGPGEARLVTSWDSDPAHVDALATAIGAL